MDYEHLELTEEQEKAAKSVYRAMRKAGKLGVQFWDNYGNLSCYNAKTVARLHMMEEPNTIPLSKNPLIEYNETLDNFSGGNSDDEIYVEPRI